MSRSSPGWNLGRFAGTLRLAGQKNKMWWKLSLTAAVLVSASLGGSNVLAPHEQCIASVGNGTPLGSGTFLRSGVADPERLYHKVWQLIQEDYFETTYNG